MVVAIIIKSGLNSSLGDMDKIEAWIGHGIRDAWARQSLLYLTIICDSFEAFAIISL